MQVNAIGQSYMQPAFTRNNKENKSLNTLILGASYFATGTVVALGSSFIKEESKLDKFALQGMKGLPTTAAKLKQASKYGAGIAAILLGVDLLYDKLVRPLIAGKIQKK